MKQIKDKNKLIAEFMGLPRYTDDYYSCKRLKNLNAHLVSTKQMKFNKDWNWLMPVVEKVGFLKNRIVIHKDFKLIYCEIICRIKHEINEEILEFGKTTIEATYKAVIEFIKWYNKDKNDKKNNTL